MNVNSNILNELDILLNTRQPATVEEDRKLVYKVGKNLEYARAEMEMTAPDVLENTSDNSGLILLHAFNNLDVESRIRLLRAGISAKTNSIKIELEVTEKHETIKLRAWMVKAVFGLVAVVIIMFTLISLFAPSNPDTTEHSTSVVTSFFEVVKLIFTEQNL